MDNQELLQRIDDLIRLFQEFVETVNGANIATYTLIGATILGWFVVSLFSVCIARYTQRKATEHQARVDVYRQLYELKQKVDTAALRLHSALEPTVIKTAAIIAHAGAAGTCVQHWNDYTKKLGDAKSDYDAASQEYRSYVDAWSHLFPKTEIITEVLFDDLIPPVDQKVNLLWIKLLKATNKPPKEWLTEDFKSEVNNVRTEILKIMFVFVGDHFDLVSNELFSGIGKKWKTRSRDTRVEENEEFEMLTLLGIQMVKGKRHKNGAGGKD